MNDLFLLYLLTRIDAVKDALCVITGTSATLYGSFVLWYFVVLASDYSYTDNDAAKLKKYLWCWIPVVFIALINVAIPTKQDVMFIAGGSAVLEAAKSDTAQRVASKSVQVVEKYLDGVLKEGEKK